MKVGNVVTFEARSIWAIRHPGQNTRTGLVVEVDATPIPFTDQFDLVLTVLIDGAFEKWEPNGVRPGRTWWRPASVSGRRTLGNVEVIGEND